MTKEEKEDALMFEREDIVETWELHAELEGTEKKKYKTDHPRLGGLFAVVDVQGREEKIEIDDGEFLTFIVPENYTVIVYRATIEEMNDNYWG